MVKKMMFAVLLGLLIPSCDLIQTFELEEPFSIRYKKKAVNLEEDISITLEDVSDFVCTYPECPAPPDTVGVELKVVNGESEEMIHLETWRSGYENSGFVPSTLVVKGYLIELIELSRPKILRNRVIMSTYSATLRVSKADPDK